MKKYLLVALILINQQAHADFWTNCTNNGGTIITANSYGNDKGGFCNDPNNSDLTNNCNGKRFCRCGNTLNWWSGSVWCEAIGGRLASFSSMCPGTLTSADATQGACANLTNVFSNGTMIFTDIRASKERALCVSPVSGSFRSLSCTYNDRYAIFCEAK